MIFLRGSNKIKSKVGKFSKAILCVLVAAVSIVPSFANCAAVEEIQAGMRLTDLFPSRAFAKYVYEDVLDNIGNDRAYIDYHLTEDDVHAINSREVIEVRGIGCESIDGIEHFTHLKYLDCSNNAIERVDVSNCRELGALICNRNKIDFLNVTDCSSLTTLKCSSNPIRELDLRSCTELKELDCSATQINALDLSNCEDIGSVNASNCDNLAGLNIAKRQYVKHVDVSNCDNLTELNLAGCPNVEDVDAHNCGHLEDINVSDAARINYINASNCEELKWIHFSPEVQVLLGFNIDNSPLVRRNVPAQLLGDDDLGDSDVEN